MKRKTGKWERALRNLKYDKQLIFSVEALEDKQVNLSESVTKAQDGKQ